MINVNVETIRNMMVAVFWVVVPCSLVEIYLCFMLGASIIRVIEAASTSGMLVIFYQTT
jgi:hypothetical protein